MSIVGSTSPPVPVPPQITPSVVADRYIQLTPVFTGGDKMASGAVIPIEKTATPVEVDQLYSSIDELASALGPEGANKNGALSDFVETGAANLEGNGEALGDSITNLSDAARTLNDSRDNISAHHQEPGILLWALSRPTISRCASSTLSCRT